MLFPVIFLVLGLVGVWFFAEVVVKKSIHLARLKGVSEAFIGLTILSIGTSVPEISTSIIAAFSVLKGVDASALAISTNIGSDIVQLTLILGLVGLLSTVYTNKAILYRDYVMMVISHLLILILGLSGKLNRFEGLFLLALYAGYLYYLTRGETIIKKNKVKDHVAYHSGILLLGLALLLICAKLVVDNSLLLSDAWGLSQTFFGSLIIGVASALPELTTALQGLRKHSQGISLGVLVGSNITNPLMGIGIGALISGFTVSKELLVVELPFILLVSVICFFFFKQGMRLYKSEAVFLIGLYVAYVLLKLWYL